MVLLSLLPLKSRWLAFSFMFPQPIHSRQSLPQAPLAKPYCGVVPGDPDAVLDHSAQGAEAFAERFEWMMMVLEELTGFRTSIEFPDAGFRRCEYLCVHQ